MYFSFFFSSRRRHTRYIGDWSSDVCSSDLIDLDFRFVQCHEQGFCLWNRSELPCLRTNLDLIHGHFRSFKLRLDEITLLFVRQRYPARSGFSTWDDLRAKIAGLALRL